MRCTYYRLFSFSIVDFAPYFYLRNLGTCGNSHLEEMDDISVLDFYDLLKSDQATDRPVQNRRQAERAPIIERAMRNRKGGNGEITLRASDLTTGEEEGR